MSILIKFVYSLLFQTLVAFITKYTIQNDNSFAQTSDKIEIKTTLKEGNFIKSNLHFQNVNLTFGEGNTICPDNNCIYELQKTSFDDGFGAENSKYLSGTLKIEDKSNSEGDFISYAFFKLSGSFDLDSSKENPKTVQKICNYTFVTLYFT